MHHNIEKIRELLIRYYEGATSEVEEQELMLFFEQGENIPEDMTADRNLFLSLAKMNESIVPTSNLEHRLITAIEHQEEKLRRRNFKRWSYSIAASAILLLSIGSYMLIESGKNPYEIRDEQLAYAKTEEALLLVSEKLNKIDHNLSKMNFTLNKKNKEKNHEKDI